MINIILTEEERDYLVDLLDFSNDSLEDICLDNKQLLPNINWTTQEEVNFEFDLLNALYKKLGVIR